MSKSSEPVVPKKAGLYYLIILVSCLINYQKECILEVQSAHFSSQKHTLQHTPIIITLKMLNLIKAGPK